MGWARTGFWHLAMGRDRPGRDFHRLSHPVLGKNGGQKEKRGKNVKKSEKKRMFLPIFANFSLFWHFFWQSGSDFGPWTSWDTGVCPGIFDPALVLGQRDSGTLVKSPVGNPKTNQKMAVFGFETQKLKVCFQFWVWALPSYLQLLNNRRTETSRQPKPKLY